MDKKNGFIPRLIVAVLILTLAATPALLAQAWAGKGRVQGVVYGPDGKPLKGVKVTLQRGGEGPAPVLTDKKGKWAKLGLAGGPWKVVLEYEGLMTSEGNIRVSGVGGPSRPISITMKNVPQAPPPEETEADKRLKLLEQGNTYLAEGKYAEARTIYEEVMTKIKDEAQHPVILRGIARTYFDEGNNTDAISTLEKGLALAPDDVESLQLIINLLVSSGRESEAKPYMERLPEGAKVDANAVLNMGIKKYNENDIEGSLEFFDKAVAENPELADAYYYRGLAYLNTGNSEGAIADFAKLLEIDPGHQNAGEAQQFLEYLRSQ